jgi:hypothetical protein
VVPRLTIVDPCRSMNYRDFIFAVDDFVDDFENRPRWLDIRLLCMNLIENNQMSDCLIIVQGLPNITYQLLSKYGLHL